VHEDGTSKERPALILSSSAACAASNDLWVAKFTKTNLGVPFQIEFHRSDPSFRSTGLTDICFLYIHLARKIPKSAFLYHRGDLSILSAALMGFSIKQALKFQIP
jgi:mRNA-degrading endonuclease toxin of MazEF toxin-antitoxin module